MTSRLRAGGGRPRTRAAVAAVRVRGGAERPWARASIAALTTAGVAAVKFRDRLGLPRPASALLAAAAPLAPMVVLRRGRLRGACVWALHMWAFGSLSELPNEHPEELRRRARISYPLRADRRLGLGTPPPQRLRRALRRPPNVTRLDQALTAFYWSWEAVPHAVLLWLLLFRPERYPRAASRLAASFDVTLIPYSLLPTAPPWFASREHGLMGGAVGRVTHEVHQALEGKPTQAGDPSCGANPLATMPSDHFATALTLAGILAEEGRLAGAAGAAYALTLGFALVYLGEHYLIDLVAGAALAGGVRALEPAAAPAFAAAGEQLRRLSLAEG